MTLLPYGDRDLRSVATSFLSLLLPVDRPRTFFHIEYNRIAIKVPAGEARIVSPRRICNENRNLCVSLFPLPSSFFRTWLTIDSIAMDLWVISLAGTFLISLSFLFPSKIFLAKAHVTFTHLCLLYTLVTKMSVRYRANVCRYILIWARNEFKIRK